MPNTTTAEIIKAIFGDRYADRGAPIWDAFEQGQFARATGAVRTSNPFDCPPLASHICTSEWYRGWDAGVPGLVERAA